MIVTYNSYSNVHLCTYWNEHLTCSYMFELLEYALCSKQPRKKFGRTPRISLHCSLALIAIWRVSETKSMFQVSEHANIF